MTTNAIGSNTSTSGSTPQTASTAFNLSSSDFVKMMITQLQNQDPLQPTSNQDLMQQMSQIGQLQSTTQLQTTLQGLATQTQIGAASSLIGKQVQGIDPNNQTVGGLVTSVQVSTSGVNLNLDSGGTLALSQVTAIAPAATAKVAGS